MQYNRKPVVGITQGDGNGIGYEVIIKALADSRILESFTPVIYGSSKIYGFYRKQIHDIEPADTNVISSAKDVHPKRINIVNCLPDNVYVEPGQATPESAKAAIRSLQAAVRDIKDGHIDVLVTAPINKRAMVSEGFGYTGHTEYLQKEFGCADVAMFMVSEQLRIGVVTGHIPLKDVAASLTKERILGKLRLMDKSLRRDFGIDAPKIAVLGLNPHCGDGGLLGDEEQSVILPAVQARRDPRHVPRPGPRPVQGPLFPGRGQFHRRPPDRAHVPGPRHGLRTGRPRPGGPAFDDVFDLYRHRHPPQPRGLRRPPRRGGQAVNR